MRFLLAPLVALLVLLPAAPSAAAGLPASWDKGFSFTAWWNDHYASATAQDSLAQMNATEPNAVSIIATWYTDDLRSSRIGPRANTPSDASLTTIIRRAHAMGLRTMLRPVVDPYSGGGWRGEYEPDDPELWFATYRPFIFHYAELAERLGVTSFSVGVELKSMTVPEYSARWRSLIAGVRSRFSGKLTYGGVYGDQVDWWDALDVYGLQWYMSLAASKAPGDNILAPREERLTEAQIVERWSSFTDEYGITHNYLAWLEDQYRRWRKPIVFTELGYPSTKEALWAPFSVFSPSRTVDMETQARAYCAAFRALLDRPWFRGVYIWQWYWDDAANKVTDTDHSPQNKLAERAIHAWFSGSQTAQPSGQESSGAPFTAPAPGSTPRKRSCRPTRARTRTTLSVRTRTPARRRAERRGGRRVSAAGHVRGAQRGAVTVRVSRRTRGHWVLQRVTTVRLRRDGRFTSVVRLTRPGRYRVDARFEGTAQAAPSRSGSRVVRA